MYSLHLDLLSQSYVANFLSSCNKYSLPVTFIY